MSDLISRQALKEKLHFMFEWYGRLPCSEEDKCIQRTIKRCMGELDKAPTVDTVEVVRCGKCQFWDSEHISSEGLAKCVTGESGIRYRRSYDFCSRGERKEATE